MKALLDTHFLLWVTNGSARLREFPWLDEYLPWGISPISLFEVQYLAEIGRVQVEIEEFTSVLRRDRRFVIDEAPWLAVIQQAFRLSWTRDPFDRFLAAHSRARRALLCTVDRDLLTHHTLLVPQLARPVRSPPIKRIGPKSR